MSYEIYTIKPGEYERIAKINHVIQINWDDDIDRIYLTFSFTTSTKLEVGTWIELYHKYDQKTAFRGIITKTSQKDEFTYTYSGYDVGFYVEKNIATIQYKKETNIIDAILQVCSDVSIPCGEFSSVNYTVKKLYKKQAVSSILKELLEIAFTKGQRRNIYFDCKNGKLNLYGYTENENLKGYVANIYSLKSTNIIHDFNITSSIEDMKNRIKIENSKLTKEYVTAPNDNITKFGVLQETIEATEKDKNYQELANKKLDALNRVKNTLSLTVLGDYNMKMGVIIPIKKDKIELNNQYLIKTSNHSIAGTKENVVINLEKYIG